MLFLSTLASTTSTSAMPSSGASFKAATLKSRSPNSIACRCSSFVRRAASLASTSAWVKVFTPLGASGLPVPLSCSELGDLGKPSLPPWDAGGTPSLEPSGPQRPPVHLLQQRPIRHLLHVRQLHQRLVQYLQRHPRQRPDIVHLPHRHLGHPRYLVQRLLHLLVQLRGRLHVRLHLQKPQLRLLVRDHQHLVRAHLDPAPWGLKREPRPPLPRVRVQPQHLVPIRQDRVQPLYHPQNVRLQIRRPVILVRVRQVLAVHNRRKRIRPHHPLHLPPRPQRLARLLVHDRPPTPLVHMPLPPIHRG